MQRLPWMDSMNVGIVEIDQDHEAMYYLMGDIARAIHEQNLLLASRLAHSFLSRVDGHFRFEAELMIRFPYPSADRHNAKHAEARGKVAALCDALADPADLILADQVLDLLERVYFRDLLTEDLEFARYVLAA